MGIFEDIFQQIYYNFAIYSKTSQKIASGGLRNNSTFSEWYSQDYSINDIIIQIPLRINPYQICRETHAKKVSMNFIGNVLKQLKHNSKKILNSCRKILPFKNF